MKKLFLAVLTISICSIVNGQTTVLSEGFESGIPATWTILDLDSNIPAEQVAEYTEAWISKTDITNASNKTASSTSFFEPTGQANRWLISPSITLGTFGNALSWRAQSHDPSYPDTYLVLVSKTDANVESFIDTIGYVQQEDAEWITRTVDLSEKGLNGETIYLAFVNITDDGFKLYLDDILLTKDDPSSVNTLNQIAVEVFPNPTTNFLTVSSDATIKSLHLKSMDGKSIRIYTKQKSIDVSFLEAGTYFIEVETEQGIGVKKFVKK